VGQIYFGDNPAKWVRFTSALTTKYTGVIAIIRAASKVLRDNGRIVNIRSGISSRGRPGFADSAATKAGLIG
jgi:NAD(P)-dependent dehydrogenase (short-subunit alcohol dehydrogenase family)